MKKILTFTVEGLTFSFRKPRFENYQATYLIPPKSVLAGMIANALNEGERFFYNLLSDFKYCAIIDDLDSRFVDLWNAIQGKGTRGGERGIFFREILFLPKYKVYLSSSNYLDKIGIALSKPENIIYLGRSEDLAIIRNLDTIESRLLPTLKVKGIIPVDLISEIQSTEWYKPELKPFLPPVEESMVNEFYSPFDDQFTRALRKIKDTIEMYIVPGANIHLKKEIDAYKVGNDDYILLF